jgi:hypothetical protein
MTRGSSSRGALAAATSDVAVESPQFSDASTLDNFGHILSTFGTGVVFSSNTGVIRNEAAASIEGLDTAIAVSGLGTTITNYGTVDCLTAVSASLAGFGIGFGPQCPQQLWPGVRRARRG